MIERSHIATLGDDAFGASIRFPGRSVESVLEICRQSSDQLLKIFYEAGGLLVLRGLDDIRDHPEVLVDLSGLFGPEVENYHQTLTGSRFFHPSVAEILVLTNHPPCNHPPPERTRSELAGEFAVQFPHRPNWHTDQSYRRPPPDITLLYGVKTPPPDQGQTLFADCCRAYLGLDSAMKKRIATLQAIHAPSWIGRSRQAVENGQQPQPLLPHQLPQAQPIVRMHPVTGKPALYLCEEKQLDYVDGPIKGMATGPYGEGARLMGKLLAHATQPEYIYRHRWQQGDLLIGDNRNLLHCASWYDAEKYSRLMWRTTVMGNPGAHYAGEQKSWIPRDGEAVMQGMAHA